MAFTGVLSPPSQDPLPAAEAQPAPEQESAGSGAAQLSEGAPPQAIRLASAPVLDPDPEPATAPVITGLAANGIPNVALNAYRVAAARMASARPSCGIDWSLLAGIGRVESNHGRYGGAVLASDGTASPRILGPALDGVDFAYIGDSDGGQWDGDTTYDRAMGPMQFIPTTWRAYAIDADGNGSTDPFDIDDAALAAANYLCVAGGDLRSDAGQRQAVFAYNHSDSYVAQVLALARAYANGIPVADLPLSGPTSGAVPAPDWTGIPAAPGPAIGATDDTTSPPGRTAGVAPSRARTGGDSQGSQGSPVGGPAPSRDGSEAPAPDRGAAPPPSRPAPASPAPPAEEAPPPAQPPAPAAPVLPPPPAPKPPPAPQPPPAPKPPPGVPTLPDGTEAVPGVTCDLPLKPACPAGT